MTWVQVAAIWSIVVVVASPLIGTWLYRRRVRHDLTVLLPQGKLEPDYAYRARMQLPREELIEAVKRDAVVPITNSAWQDRARRAEALGFMDDGSDLPRAS